MNSTVIKSGLYFRYSQNFLKLSTNLKGRVQFARY